eukprot:1962769-Pyramimonas_sp.AAC.1
MGRYFNAAAARLTKTCDAQVAPRPAGNKLARSTVGLGMRPARGLLCRPHVLAHDDAIKAIFKTVMSATSGSGANVPTWGNILKPVW